MSFSVVSDDVDLAFTRIWKFDESASAQYFVTFAPFW